MSEAKKDNISTVEDIKKRTKEREKKDVNKNEKLSEEELEKLYLKIGISAKEINDMTSKIISALMPSILQLKENEESIKKTFKNLKANLQLFNNEIDSQLFNDTKNYSLSPEQLSKLQYSSHAKPEINININIYKSDQENNN